MVIDVSTRPKQKNRGACEKMGTLERPRSEKILICPKEQHRSCPRDALDHAVQSFFHLFSYFPFLIFVSLAREKTATGKRKARETCSGFFSSDHKWEVFTHVWGKINNRRGANPRDDN